MCIVYIKKQPSKLPSSESNKLPRASSSSTMFSSSSSPQNNMDTSLTRAHSDSETRRSRGSMHTSNTKTAKKRVSFESAEPQVVCTMKPASSMTDAQRSQTYWQVDDYNYFRGTARIIASEILKFSASQLPSPHAYDVVLTRAHQICAMDQVQEEKQDQDPNSSLSMRIPDDQDVCLPTNLFAALTHWAKAGHSRRGLEKFCVPHHTQARILDRQTAVQAVLLAQELLAETRRNETSSGHHNKGGKFHIGTWSFPLSLPDHEILRMVSMRFTKTSRRFATTMGHADAAAVGNYKHSKNV